MNEYCMARFQSQRCRDYVPSIWSFMPSIQSNMPSIQSFMPSTQSFMPSIQSIMPSIQLLCGEPGASPSSNPWTDLAVYGLNDASWPKDVPFGVLMTTRNFKGFKPPKTCKKEARLVIFQPHQQNHKIAISPTANIRSTPNFHRTTEQYSRLRGWSRLTKFQFKMADGRHIDKCLKCYNSSTSEAIWTKLGWSHPIICQTWPP